MSTPDPKSTEERTRDLMVSLRFKLKSLAPATGWDAPRVDRKTSDLPGYVWVGYLAHQGELRVSIETGEAYLEWLEAGNCGTLIRWSAMTGRKLK